MEPGAAVPVFAPQPGLGTGPDFALEALRFCGEAGKGWHVPGRKKKRAAILFFPPFLINKKILLCSNRNLLLRHRTHTGHLGASQPLRSETGCGVCTEGGFGSPAHTGTYGRARTAGHVWHDTYSRACRGVQHPGLPCPPWAKSTLRFKMSREKES